MDSVVLFGLVSILEVNNPHCFGYSHTIKKDLTLL
jgi:hypothetical protein